MACFLRKSLLANEFNCDKCQMALNNNLEQPRILPCGETICSTCAKNIEKEANDNKFKCIICSSVHHIPDNGLPLNKKIFKIMSAEAVDVSRGKEHEKLKSNLDKISLATQLLSSEFKDGTNMIDEHYVEQMRLIQLAIKKKIAQVDISSDFLISSVKDYKNSCTEFYLTVNKPILEEELNQIVNETKSFIQEKETYLKQNKLDDEEIKRYNNQSEDFQLKLNEKAKKLKSIVFNNNLFQFISNIKEKTNSKNLLGYFYSENMREPSVYFYFSIIIIQINI